MKKYAEGHVIVLAESLTEAKQKAFEQIINHKKSYIECFSEDRETIEALYTQIHNDLAKAPKIGLMAICIEGSA